MTLNRDEGSPTEGEYEVIKTLNSLADSWPISCQYGRFISETDTVFLMTRGHEYLIEAECWREHGDVVYQLTKLKLQAKHYGYNYSVPSEYQEACREKEEEMMQISFWKERRKSSALKVLWGAAGVIAITAAISQCQEKTTNNKSGYNDNGTTVTLTASNNAVPEISEP